MPARSDQSDRRPSQTAAARRLDFRAANGIRSAMTDVISQSELQARLDFALAVAREAGALILGYYQSDALAVERKRDSSPVTAADRGAEELIRKRIGETFHGDGVLGEE